MIDSYDFYRSPEFQALCKRFDIDLLKDTTQLTLVVGMEGEPVKVLHEYRPAETTKEQKEAWQKMLDDAIDQARK